MSRVGLIFRSGKQSYYGYSNMIEDIVCTVYRYTDNIIEGHKYHFHIIRKSKKLYRCRTRLHHSTYTTKDGP